MEAQLKKLFGTAMELLPKECHPDAMRLMEYMKETAMVKGLPNEMDGYQLHPMFEPETARYAYDELQLGKGDILIATYPKTGTTWMLAVIQHILHGKNPEELKKYSALRRFIGYIEFGPKFKYDIWKKLSFPQQVFGTHLPAPLVNLKRYREMGVKVIYVIRNPKDQMVSWRNFVRNFPYAKMDHWKDLLPDNEKEFYDMCLAGKQRAFAREGEGYLECVREWYEHKNDDNVLFVIFEEMKKDPKKEIKKIAEFTGHPLSDEDLNEVVEKTSFQSMKDNYGKQGLDSSSGITMFRKGQIGGWKNHLTVAQSELVDRKVKEILGDTDIQFIYE